MLTNRIRAAVLTAVIVAIISSSVSAQSGYDLFQQALVKERAEGRPDEAIALYQGVLDQAGLDRGLKAKALVQLARCYQKLGNSKATNVYQQVLREYADQPGPVADARAALNGPSRSSSAISFTSRTADPEPRRVDLPWGATLSPDGRYVAIVTAGDFIVRDIHTGEGKTLAHATNSEAVGAFAWSSDARRLAYVWGFQGPGKKRTTEIRLINRDGSNRRVLLSGSNAIPGGLAWSGDGTTITFQARGELGLALDAVSLADGTVRELKRRSSPVAALTYSSDGRYLVYSVMDPASTTAIFSLDTTNGMEQPLIQDSTHNQFVGWTPAAGLLFVSDRAGTPDLWLTHFESGRTVGLPVNLKKDVGFVEARGMTPEGALYYHTTDSSDVYVVKMDPRTSRVMSGPALVRQGIGHSDLPVWSPDGTQLAFKSGSGPGAMWTAISIVTMDTGSERRLSPQLRGLAPLFAWSPDGKYFLNNGNPETYGRAAANWNLYRVDVKTAELGTIINYGTKLRFTVPQWFPDGKAVTGLVEEGKVIRRDIATGTEDVIADSQWLLTYVVSPDGQSIAWKASRDDSATTADLYVTTIADNRTRKLVELTNDADGLSWSSDSRYVVYFNRTSDKIAAGTTLRQSELWRIPAAGGAPERLGLAADHLSHAALSPDGRRLAFSQVIDRSGTWVLDGFLPAAELRARLPQ